MRLTVSGGTPRLVLVGALDAEGAPFLTATADDVIARRPADMVVDCSELTLLAAAGVTALLAVRDRARQAGVAVHLHACTGLVQSVVERAGLDDALLDAPPQRSAS